MKRNIALYIANRQVDLDDDSFVLLNYTRENMSNPTAVRNSYSQSITVKGTPANNRIFGDIWRCDRITRTGVNYDGVYFDVLRRTPFTIYKNGAEILETGYCKLDSISRDAYGNVTYSVSLFGGLGEFFYSLMYFSDGTKKTLANLRYHDLDNTLVIPDEVSVSLDRAHVGDAWEWLAERQFYGTTHNILNFAPMYEGIPATNFDANRFKVGPSQFRNISVPGTDTLVEVTTEEKHTQWETRDFRSYLQRPVISVKSIIDGICDSSSNGGYTIHLDADWFAPQNDYYSNGWMTLPLIDREKHPDLTQLTLADFLYETDSPADYLIGLAKMFGWIFLIDKDSKDVHIYDRRNFYDGTESDLTPRTDLSKGVLQTPTQVAARWYEWNQEPEGELAKAYKDKLGRVYGSFRVDTNYKFDHNTVSVLDTVYKGAADVLESSPFFASYVDQDGTYFPFSSYDKCTIVADRGGSSVNTDVQAADLYTRIDYNIAQPFLDLNAKVQIHDADQKWSSGGQNILVFFGGMKSLPDTTFHAGWHLSDDHGTMGDTPCWEMRTDLQYANVTPIADFPQFRRCLMDGIHRDLVWDMGEAREVYVPGEVYSGGSTIYPQYWQSYAADRYDRDTRTLTLYVDLSGLQVNESLFRRFWWYDGSWWVLNRIVNHSLTTYDATQCEFIKVNDTTNYT